MVRMDFSPQKGIVALLKTGSSPVYKSLGAAVELLQNTQGHCMKLSDQGSSLIHYLVPTEATTSQERLMQDELP